jgi:methionyl aminopeptidase
LNVYDEAQVDLIRRSCKIVSAVLQQLAGRVLPGVSTREIDFFAESLILEMGGRPAFKGYRGYPAAVCASVNEQVVHGIPDKKTILREGDILGIDIGAEREGYFGDSAMTFPVGEISEEASALLFAAKRALEAGIEKAEAGGRLHDISSAVQSCAEGAGFSVVRNFVGHGIGANLHEEPPIPNFGRAGTGPELRPGMVLAIEPMVNAGAYEVRIGKDGWTAVTADGSLSAHFEHTVLVTEGKPEVLTSR